MESWERISIYLSMLCLLGLILMTKFELKESNCSDSQLHQVIEKVEACTKSKVICSSDDKDKILKEICK